MIANPDQDLGAGPAMYSAINQMLGESINGWAGGDPDMLIEQIGKVSAWDKENPNPQTSKRKNEEAYESVRQSYLK